MDRRLRRNAIRINQGLERFGRQVGQDVLWYEWNAASVEDEDSSDPGPQFDDDLYDEGGSQPGRPDAPVGRNAEWWAPVTVRVLQAVLNEGEQEFQDIGNYTVDRLSIVVAYEALVKAGISNPTDRGGHMNDRIGYDGRLFSVDAFNPRGRIANVPGFTVSVMATEIKDDELAVGDADWASGDRKPPG